LRTSEKGCGARDATRLDDIPAAAADAARHLTKMPCLPSPDKPSAAGLPVANAKG
jgi:hypothetical protein